MMLRSGLSYALADVVDLAGELAAALMLVGVDRLRGGLEAIRGDQDAGRVVGGVAPPPSDDTFGALLGPVVVAPVRDGRPATRRALPEPRPSTPQHHRRLAAAGRSR